MPSRVLLLHGPNLNLLLDLPALDATLEERAAQLDIDLHIFQANSEGALVDALHAQRTRVSGVIVNAAKLAPTAEVLAEALALVKRPSVEVVTDAGQKSRSALKGVVLKQVTGKDAYATALQMIATELRAGQGRPTGLMPMESEPHVTVTDEETRRIDREQVKKTLGRRALSDPPTMGAGTKKTIGRLDGTDKLASDGSGLTRGMVKDKIAERLSGKLSPSGLATWARSQWQQMQRGAPVESGHRDRLEDVLQTLLLTAASKANDHQLIELMTQLG